eukprot:8767834-Pyramimonas_sp.AAC.1
MRGRLLPAGRAGPPAGGLWTTRARWPRNAQRKATTGPNIVPRRCLGSSRRLLLYRDMAGVVQG